MTKIPLASLTAGTKLSQRASLGAQLIKNLPAKQDTRL